jgi:hypothetical protein
MFPLVEIMDVGFIVVSPIIILLLGYGAPLAMLAHCLLAILTGFAISYNINNYEPLIGRPDPLHRWNSIALWALVAASIVNVAYYAQLLMTLVWLPLGDLYSPGLVTASAAALASQLSAIVNDTESRTEIWAQEAGDRLPRQWTFPLFLGLARPLHRHRVGDGRGSGSRHPDLSRWVVSRPKPFARQPFQSSRSELSEVRAGLTAPWAGWDSGAPSLCPSCTRATTPAPSRSPKATM